ncbi:hypothetical protein HK105_207836 [Polyrhizophydium stewartii]|uniref:Uncharacterized protein n=1 Tax=Polyrhizophydium stewartii TaxID=2732419 RepID=A0ABR4MZK6_9FUNG
MSSGSAPVIAHTAPGTGTSPAGAVASLDLVSLKELRGHLQFKRPMPAISLFDRIRVEFPKLLARMSLQDFAELVSMVALSVDLPPGFSPEMRIETARRILATAKEMGVTLGHDTRRLMLAVHASVGDFEGLNKLLIEMRQTVTYISAKELLAAQSRAYLLAGRDAEGMQFWKHLRDMDNSGSPYVHLFETQVLRGSISDALHTLETMEQQFQGMMPGTRYLLRLCRLMLAQKDLDGLVRLFYACKRGRILQKHPISAAAACELALAGRFRDTLAILDVRRETKSTWTPKHTFAEIVAIEGLGDVDRLPALFGMVGRFSGDSDIEVEVANVFAKLVGPTASADHLQVQMEADSLISKPDNHVALLMLLRGYAQRADSQSVMHVLTVLMRRRLGVPLVMLVPVLEVVVDQRGGEEAVCVLESMASARLPYINQGPYYVSAATPILKRFPELESRVIGLHPSVAGLLEERQPKVEGWRETYGQTHSK